MTDVDSFANAERVRSRGYLERHILALRANILVNSDEWANASLDGFLEAFAAWVGDMDGYFMHRDSGRRMSRPGRCLPRCSARLRCMSRP